MFTTAIHAIYFTSVAARDFCLKYFVESQPGGPLADNQAEALLPNARIEIWFRFGIQSFQISPGKRIRQRIMDFSRHIRRLDWCLNCHAIFVLLPPVINTKLT
jgi:hypothetical protein